MVRVAGRRDANARQELSGRALRRKKKNGMQGAKSRSSGDFALCKSAKDTANGCLVGITHRPLSYAIPCLFDIASRRRVALKYPMCECDTRRDGMTSSAFSPLQEPEDKDQRMSGPVDRHSTTQSELTSRVRLLPSLQTNRDTAKRSSTWRGGLPRPQTQLRAKGQTKTWIRGSRRDWSTFDTE